METVVVLVDFMKADNVGMVECFQNTGFVAKLFHLGVVFAGLPTSGTTLGNRFNGTPFPCLAVDALSNHSFVSTPNLTRIIHRVNGVDVQQPNLTVGGGNNKWNVALFGNCRIKRRMGTFFFLDDGWNVWDSIGVLQYVIVAERQRDSRVAGTGQSVDRVFIIIRTTLATHE